MKNELEHLVLKRKVDRALLLLLEDAAQTETDFESLIQEWDRIDRNREKREQNHEDSWNPNIFYESIEEFEAGAIIPPPLDHAWWRQLQSGNFIDIIYDCPHEIAELTSHKKLFYALNTLKAEQKEVLYYLAIRQWSPQQLAAYRGQTDRNIRKVYAALIRKIHREMEAFKDEKPESKLLQDAL